MQKFMKLLSVLLVIIFSFLVISCKTENSGELTDKGIDPFNNGSNDRNMIVVISDIHLGADLSFAECNKNLAALENLIKKVKASPNVKELVIAGDLLDEWFVPAPIDAYQGKDQAVFMRRIAVSNKGVVDALRSIIDEKKILLTYVPGNHDLTVTEASVNLILPGINQARDPELGLGTYYVSNHPEIAIEHGHRYNFFCAPDPYSNQDIAPGTISPPGYFFTRIGALHVSQGFPPAGDSIPLVTKNTKGNASQDLLYEYWKVWERSLKFLTIKNKFDEKMIVTNFDGFKGKFSVKDFLPYQTTPGGLIKVGLYNGIQDTWNQRQAHNRVAVNIPIERAIMSSALESESDEQAKIQYFLNPKSKVRIVVFGHTHVAKIETSNNHEGKKSIYANSGTWIDNNHSAPTTMNFVVITPQKNDESSETSVKLYNFKNEAATLMAENSVRL